MIITVTPNPSIDWTVTVSTLRRGAVHRAGSRTEEPSGKGVNVSRALTVNGVPTLAVLPLGGRQGDDLAQLLTAEQVRHRAVPVRGPTRVNISLTEADGTATKVNEPGPTLSAAEADALLAAAVTAAEGAHWVLGSGSLPGGVPPDFYSRLAAGVRAAGARFALDSSGAPLLAGLPAEPDLVKPNADELAQAVGRPLATLGDVAAAADELRRAGARTVVVSLGADGALLAGAAGVLHAESPVDRPASTVGAGDALVAGYLAGASRAGADRFDALREALAWGSGAVRLAGSLVPVIGAADRAAVALDTDPDFGRRLRDPGSATPG